MDIKAHKNKLKDLQKHRSLPFTVEQGGYNFKQLQKQTELTTTIDITTYITV